MKASFRVAVTVLMFAPLWVTTAHGDAMQCKVACGLLVDSGELEACNARCDAAGGDSSQGGGGVPAQSGRWTAIVFDRATARWGTSWGFRDGQTARGVARKNCFDSGGKSCDWPMTQYDGCLAVAHGTGQSGLVAHATARSRGGRAVATQKALAECRSGGGRNCSVVAAACSWQ